MKKFTLIPTAIIIGIVNAIVLICFEFIGVDVTNWLWNDVLHTDVHRWLMLPVAIVLGLLLTATFKVFKTTRIVRPDSDLMAEMNDAPANLTAIGIVLAVGAMCLLAGASLGPEASLVAASAAMGAYAANKTKLQPARQVLILASIGALLVAFIGSILLVLAPVLIMLQSQKKQGKPLQLKPIMIVLLAGVASFITIQAYNYLTHKSGGYGSAPTMPSYASHDFVLALVLGFVAGFIALSLNWLITQSWKIADKLDKRRLPGGEWILGSIFALVLGGLYLLGGRTTEFSGSIGSNLLANSGAEYGALALVGLIIIKIGATAWSKGTGYRGGLVFPSIYTGVALGLLVGQLWSNLGGPGAMIGGISGILTAAVGSPIMAAIFLVALLPLKLWPVAFAAIIGTILFDRVSKKLTLIPKTSVPEQP